MRDGKKCFGYQLNGVNATPVDVLSLWNNANCYFETVRFIQWAVREFQPISGKRHFAAFKKMIARQRRRIEYFCLGSKTEELMDDVAEILGVCGGVEHLTIDRDIAPIAPIVKKLISDGGVYGLRLYPKFIFCIVPRLVVSYPDWLVPTLVAQVQQEHGYYHLVHPKKYVDFLRPLQEELKCVSSESTIHGQDSLYSHPEEQTKVICKQTDRYFSYEWRKHNDYHNTW
uniref:Lipid A biosynthesis lauroyl acyltransferase n=1 Tax=Steinernema glaseri TaxID=37863 RepID=A0A1I7YM91_9BILA